VQRRAREVTGDTSTVKTPEKAQARAIAIGTVGGLVLIASGLGITGCVDWPQAARWTGSHAGPIISVALGSALLAAAVRTWRRPARSAPVKPTVALSWWIVAGAGGVVAIVSWAASAWLLGEASRAADVAASRIEAIKTGLSIGAGTGGAFALLLAVRRQWHQEITAAATEHDAAERRVTDLYTKAVELLGSERAPVRLGGMYALERLAQDNSNHRQTVIDVLCAYLRMPFLTFSHVLQDGEPVLPATANSYVFLEPGSRVMSGPTEELEVRLAAQSIIREHLSVQDKSIDLNDRFWPNIDLDFRGAQLIEFSLDSCTARRAQFLLAQFYGLANFRDTKFHMQATFDRTFFYGDVHFIDTRFNRSSYRGARFYSKANFARAVFKEFPDFGSPDHKITGSPMLAYAWVFKPEQWRRQLPSGWKFEDGGARAHPDAEPGWKLITPDPEGKSSTETSLSNESQTAPLTNE
jgi:Pentapeptide repeats (9 copies)